MKGDFQSNEDVSDTSSYANNTKVSSGSYFYGTEIELSPTTANGWVATIKIQTGRDEHRNYRVTAPSQTALFELVKLVLSREPK